MRVRPAPCRLARGLRAHFCRHLLGDWSRSLFAKLGGSSRWHVVVPLWGGGSSAKRGAFSSLPCKGAGKGSRARRTATTSPRHSLPWLVCPDFSGVSLGRGSHCSKVLSDYNFPTLGAFFPISMGTRPCGHGPLPTDQFADCYPGSCAHRLASARRQEEE